MDKFLKCNFAEKEQNINTVEDQHMEDINSTTIQKTKQLAQEKNKSNLPYQSRSNELAKSKSTTKRDFCDEKEELKFTPTKMKQLKRNANEMESMQVNPKAKSNTPKSHQKTETTPNDSHQWEYPEEDKLDTSNPDWNETKSKNLTKSRRSTREKKPKALPVVEEIPKEKKRERKTKQKLNDSDTIPPEVQSMK